MTRNWISLFIGQTRRDHQRRCVSQVGGHGGLDCQVPLINNGTVDTQTGRITLADGSGFNSGCNFIGVGETRLDSGVQGSPGFFTKGIRNARVAKGKR